VVGRGAMDTFDDLGDCAQSSLCAARVANATGHAVQDRIGRPFTQRSALVSRSRHGRIVFPFSAVVSLSTGANVRTFYTLQVSSLWSERDLPKSWINVE